MAIEVRCVTDPACVWSWAFEPVVRALMVEFGDHLEWTFVMGGLAREQGPEARDAMVQHWLEATDETGMPTDPLGWWQGPLRSTYPACIAVKAAQQQGRDAGYRYLRALREGIVALRRRLDSPEALVGEAGAARLDVERFRVDLDSHATLEAFGGDLDESRQVPDVVRAADKVRCSPAVDEERVPFPTLSFSGESGERHWTCGMRPLDYVREAALAAGARPADQPRPTPLEALRRFGRMAPVEVAAVCDMPLTRADAELAQLALDWRARPTPVLAGRLWELAA